ncbi:hypothetical protein PAPYR_12586 [Paratrimastix pyriformis]|uniref:Uncharacterized protein n=1 Tax=Paratrimastix pyriformis TaxID=342808 RepID=A0ABQ8U1N1_9EUKA|nr:hypothetical protein PAPYR_12586 [Paratrimastix pyriformis]
MFIGFRSFRRMYCQLPLRERQGASESSIKKGKNLLSLPSQVLLHETSGSYVDLQLGCRCFDYHAPQSQGRTSRGWGGLDERAFTVVVEVYQRPKGWVQRPFPKPQGFSISQPKS